MRIQGQSGKQYRKSVASAVKLRDACEKVDVLGFNRGFILTAVLFNDIGFSLYEIKENYIYTISALSISALCLSTIKFYKIYLNKFYSIFNPLPGM